MMQWSRNRLYGVLIFACLLGYMWLFFQRESLANQHTGISVCLIKKITTIPCPSCGSTRALLALWEGHFWEALYWNPLGFVLFAIMTITPIWILIDWLLRRDSFFRRFHIFIKTIQQRKVAIYLITLVLANWIWNICKGL